MEGDQKGFITKIENGLAFLQESLVDKKGQIIKIRTNQITYKGNSTPVNLLAVNTPVYIRKKGEGVYEAYLDPQLDIFVKFGYVKAINESTQTLTISDYIIDYDLKFSKLLSSSGKQIPIPSINGSLNSYVYMYFNSDSLIEVKLTESNLKINLKLDTFTKINNIIDHSLFCFKDSRLVNHKIPAENVFYQNSDINFPIDKVQENLGRDAELFFIDGKIRTQIKIAAPKGSNLSLNIKSKSPENYAQGNVSSTKIQESQTMRAKAQAGQQNRNINPTSSFQTPGRNTVQIMPLENLMQGGWQNNLERYRRKYETTLGWFYKAKENESESFLVLFSLLETSFRFPESNTRNILWHKLVGKMNEINPDLQNNLNQIYTYSRCIFQNTQLTDLYSKVYERIAEFDALAKILFEPLNFEDISDCYEVVIYEYKPSNQSYTTYYPFSKGGSRFPYIMLQQEQGFKILYSKEFMQLDGFNPETGFPEKCLDVNTGNFFIVIQPTTPNIAGIFQIIKDLQEIASESLNINQATFNEKKNQAVACLKSLADTTDETSFLGCKELYKVIQDSKYKFPTPKCDGCQLEKLTKYKCLNSHKLCKECVLLSNIRGCALCCESQEKFDISNEHYHCIYCRQSYESKYYISISPCKCVFDIECGKSIYSTTQCPIHGMPISNEELQLIWKYQSSLQ